MDDDESEISMEDVGMLMAFSAPWIRQAQMIEVMRSFLAATKQPEWFSNIFKNRRADEQLLILGRHRMGDVLFSIEDDHEIPAWLDDEFTPEKKRFTIFHFWVMCRVIKSFQPYDGIVRKILGDLEARQGDVIVYDQWRNLDALYKKRLAASGNKWWSHLRPFLMMESWAEIDRFQENQDCCSMRELIARACKKLEEKLGEEKARKIKFGRDLNSIYVNRVDPKNLPAMNLDWWERVFPCDGRKIPLWVTVEMESISSLFMEAKLEEWSPEELRRRLSQHLPEKIVSLWF